MIALVEPKTIVVNNETIETIFEMWMSDGHKKITERIPVIVIRERDEAALPSKLLTESKAEQPH